MYDRILTAFLFITSVACTNAVVVVLLDPARFQNQTLEQAKHSYRLGCLQANGYDCLEKAEKHRQWLKNL